MTISEIQFYQDKLAPHKLHQSWSIICVKYRTSCIVIVAYRFGKPLPLITLEKKWDSFLRVPKFDLLRDVLIFGREDMFDFPWLILCAWSIMLLNMKCSEHDLVNYMIKTNCHLCTQLGCTLEKKWDLHFGEKWGYMVVINLFLGHTNCCKLKWLKSTESCPLYITQNLAKSTLALKVVLPITFVSGYYINAKLTHFFVFITWTHKGFMVCLRSLKSLF